MGDDSLIAAVVDMDSRLRGNDDRAEAVASIEELGSRLCGDDGPDVYRVTRWTAGLAPVRG